MRLEETVGRIVVRVVELDWLLRLRLRRRVEKDCGRESWTRMAGHREVSLSIPQRKMRLAGTD